MLDLVLINPNNRPTIYQTLGRTLAAVGVLRFRDNAFHTYFTSRSYLELVRQKSGDETLAHIQMTGHRLERSLYACA